MSDGNKVALGRTALRVSPLCVGTCQWGNQQHWGYGRDYGDADLEPAFRYALDASVDFFDTAEIYGDGTAERVLGRFARDAGRPVVVAGKFMPFPWRLDGKELLAALR